MGLFSISPSCQTVIAEDFPTPDSCSITIRSNLADSKIWPVVGDHRVNEVALVPSGLYGAMAIEVTKYILSQARPLAVSNAAINVCDMHIEKPYAPKNPLPEAGSWLEMETTAELRDLDGRTDGQINCSFRRIEPDGSKPETTASCTARLEDPNVWVSEWSSLQGPITTQIRNLQTRAGVERSSSISIFQRDLAYKRFRTFVGYDRAYRSMREVIIDYETLEGTALIEFPADPTSTCVAPYDLDAIGHLSGFVCNESEGDNKKNGYISHGWKAMKQLPWFDPRAADGKPCRNYVRLQSRPNGVIGGDLYFMHGEELVAVYEGVEFKRIPRRALNFFLPPPKTKHIRIAV